VLADTPEDYGGDIHWHAVSTPGGMLRSVRDCTPICITPLRSDR
jgi:hypothetical protein